MDETSASSHRTAPHGTGVCLRMNAAPAPDQQAAPSIRPGSPMHSRMAGGAAWPLFRQVFLLCMVLTLFALLTIGGIAHLHHRRSYLQHETANLRAQATVLALNSAPLLEQTPAPPPSLLAEHLLPFRGHPDDRLTLIRPDGHVLADTDGDPDRMDNHRLRPEILQALTDGEGQSIRFSPTIRRTLFYHAVAIRTADNRLVGVARISRPMEDITLAFSRMRNQLLVAALLLTMLLGAASWIVCKRLSAPLEGIRNTALRLERGELDVRVAGGGSREIEELAHAFNAMAGSLEQTIRTIHRQNQEADAILAGMANGVIALDKSFRILQINHAAGTLLSIDPDTAKGAVLHEVVRRSALLQLAETLMNTRAPIRAEIELLQPSGGILDVQGTPLTQPDGSRLGGVLLLRDITPQRRLEEARRSFVENASHELRTPVTAIQGFLETLLDGALEDPAMAMRFTDLAAKHARRLGHIISDLLHLSRLESGRAEGIDLQPVPLVGILVSVIEDVRLLADAKGITIHLSCPDTVCGLVHPPLLEQAVSNLVHNAIQYSPERTRIDIRARIEGGEAVIEVQDTGCGIPAHHLPRLFERFYRVDTSRSRSLGGTGLGLSIVKHILNVHKGRVEVESTPQVGSVFRLCVQAAVSLPPMGTEAADRAPDAGRIPPADSQPQGAGQAKP